MTETTSRSQLVDRRGELLAELFLEDLQPEFVARPSADLGYDFFAGFRNPRGGVNVIAIVVKATESHVRNSSSMSKELYNRWANSNIPVLLLIANVKVNKLFYHWPSAEVSRESHQSIRLQIPITEIDDQTMKQLRDRLSS